MSRTNCPAHEITNNYEQLAVAQGYAEPYTDGIVRRTLQNNVDLAESLPTQADPLGHVYDEGEPIDHDPIEPITRGANTMVAPERS
jgi:hypothetical protein